MNEHLQCLTNYLHNIISQYLREKTLHIWRIMVLFGSYQLDLSRFQSKAPKRFVTC